MKIVKCLFFLPLLLFLLPSCEREIEFDYHSSPPLYVIEAKVSQTQATVLVTTTQDMTDNTRDHNVTSAQVTITSGDSLCQTLTHRSGGRYTANIAGKPGTTYQLTVDIDGQRYTASSTMQQRPQMNSFRFVWQEFMSERILFGDLRLQDIPGQTNYYFMHLYQNGIGYRWAVMTDKSNPGEELQQLFTCMREGSTDSDVLRDGDRIHLVIRTIDRAAYDYLFSMQTMENNGSNPVTNFSGGCLGYFSAYHEITHDVTFRYTEVEEE